jgi:hypothetical protein
MRYEPTQWRGGGGSSGTAAGLRQASARGGGGVTGGRRARVEGRLPPMPPHLYIGVEGAGGLPSKPLGSLVKGGGRKSLLSFPHRSLPPLFRDLDLIPSGYDPIPCKGGLGAPRPGVWSLSPPT